MRFVIQRVREASVEIDGEITGKIGQGFAVLIGVSEDDTKEVADKMVHKLLNMRIFEDADGKTNLSLTDVSGNLLLVSQFTLYADCKKGNRPSFIHAAGASLGEELYEYIIAQCKKTYPDLQTGVFGAFMKVALVNDGPFTIVLDSDAL